MALYVTGTELIEATQGANASDVELWDVYAESASRILDLAVETPTDFFAAAAAGAEAATQVFYPENINMFRLPPFVDEIEDVAVDDDLLDEDDWRVSGAVGMQFLINMAEDFDSDKSLSVTAIWGFEAVPAEVKAVAREIGVYLWRQKDPLFASQSNFEKLYDNLSPTANVLIKKLRDKYSQTAY